MINVNDVRCLSKSLFWCVLLWSIALVHSKECNDSQLFLIITKLSVSTWQFFPAIQSHIIIIALYLSKLLLKFEFSWISTDLIGLSTTLNWPYKYLLPTVNSLSFIFFIPCFSFYKKCFFLFSTKIFYTRITHNIILLFLISKLSFHDDLFIVWYAPQYQQWVVCLSGTIDHTQYYTLFSTKVAEIMRLKFIHAQK